MKKTVCGWHDVSEMYWDESDAAVAKLEWLYDWDVGEAESRIL